MRLLLARHGNTFASHETPVQIGLQTDLPLTEQGKDQARILGLHLFQKYPLCKAVFAGELKRQLETAEILSQILQAPLHSHFSAFNEIDYGIWEGKTAQEIQAGWRVEYVAWTQKGVWPRHVFGGSEEKHLENITQWLEHLRASYADGDMIVAVGSQGILRMFHPQRHQEIKVKTGHYCELALTQQSLQVVGWNLYT